MFQQPKFHSNCYWFCSVFITIIAIHFTVIQSSKFGVLQWKLNPICISSYLDEIPFKNWSSTISSLQQKKKEWNQNKTDAQIIMIALFFYGEKMKIIKWNGTRSLKYCFNHITKWKLHLLRLSEICRKKIQATVNSGATQKGKETYYMYEDIQQIDMKKTRIGSSNEQKSTTLCIWSG